jgi:hypothetical protein
MDSDNNIICKDLGRSADGTFYAELQLGPHEIVVGVRSPAVEATSQELPFIPTTFQRAILEALDGRSLKKQQLADKVCGGHGSRLYRRGGLKELMERGIVVNKPGAGYFRPNQPPTNW